MKHTIISKFAIGAAALALAAVAFVSVPASALAWYGGGYGGYGGYGGGYYQSYPPAPTHYNTGTVQVVYPNGYYFNYFTPTVRYFPPAYNVGYPMNNMGGYGGYNGGYGNYHGGYGGGYGNNW